MAHTWRIIITKDAKRNFVHARDCLFAFATAALPKCENKNKNKYRLKRGAQKMKIK
jgi:hypothetical protein